MAKVPSVEEFMISLRDEKTKQAKESTRDIKSQISIATTPKEDPEDFTAMVAEKVEKDGLSYSSLKAFRESPLSFIHYLTAPYRQTDAMRLGDIVDGIATEPDKFEENFFIFPELVDRRSNRGKAVYALYMEMAGKKTVITMEEYDKAMKMVEALWNNSDSRYYLERVKETQKWVRFTHSETKLKVRGKLDGVSEDEPKDFTPFIMDLKTAADASTDGFQRQAAKLWYNGQAGVYTMGYKSRWLFPDYINVVVETKAPYNVNVLRASAEYIRLAQEEVHNTLMTFKYVQKENLWNRSYEIKRAAHGLTYDALDLPGYYKPKY